MQRIAPPLPRPRRLLEQSVHAVRVDPSWIHETAIMHAPQERIMHEDRPLHALEGRNSRTEGAFHGGDHGCQGVKHQVELVSRHHEHLCGALVIRFAKQNTICDRDCCRCISLSPVTATPQRFALDTEACAVCASRRRHGTDDLPWIFLVRLTRLVAFSSRARRCGHSLP